MARSEGESYDANDAGEEDLSGRAFGKYTLTRVIGRGGMGVVYEAQNTVIGKRVAIKLVSADLAKNKDAIVRFQREAQAASSVESAHIVDIFDAGTSDEGVPFLVMELLRGEDLGHRIKRLGRLELDEALHIIAQLLRGLSRAHAAGIVHRDLKPDNVFLVDRDDDAPFVKILDFGISKVARTGGTPVQTLTKEGTVLGTPFYMSPEQAQGLSDTDNRADLWSVGAILYECLSGRAPHTGASYEQVIVHICTKDAVDIRTHNPGVPEPVAQLVAKALAREREDRFATAREMLTAIALASDGQIPVPSRSPDESLSGDRMPIPVVSSPSGNRGVSGGSTPISSETGSEGSEVATPRLSGSAFEDTVEMLKGGGPSRVGWSTSSGSTVYRDRRRKFVVIAGVATLAGAVIAAVVTRDPPSSSGAASEPTIVAQPVDSEVTVQLRANVPSARFFVDGRLIAGGLLRGPRGQTKKVVIEADGYIPMEAVVSLVAGNDPPELVLHPISDSPQLGSTASASASFATAALSAPRTATSAPPTGVYRNGQNTGAPTATSSSSAPAVSAAPTTSSSAPVVTPAHTAAPTVTVTVAPSATPTLTIKRE